MADIAVVFGWSPGVMDPMSLDEFAGWWARARRRAPREEGEDDG